MQYKYLYILHPRTYTREFGESLLDIYRSHLGSDATRRDLRFKPQIEMVGSFDEVDIFNAIPLKDDVWDDACLLGPLKYLMTSSKLRWENSWISCWHTVLVIS